MRYRTALLALAFLFATPAPTGKLSGKFTVGGEDAQLKYVRAQRMKLDDKGHMGIAVLMSAKPLAGDIQRYRAADPVERGSYVLVVFDQNNDVWVADLGHIHAKSRPFGVMTEIKKAAYSVKDGRIAAHITTGGEQVFTEDHYSVDLTFDAPIEP
jgi:hypothetical protein